MKKRGLILTSLLLLVVAVAAGCGKKNKKEDDSSTNTQVTVAPTEGADSDSQDSELVNMEENTEESISNVMGEETDTSTKVIFVNRTGSEIAKIYIRPHTDDDEEWGDDLVNGMFTLKDSEKALYYFESSEKDSDGNTVSSYDIRITYSDEDKNECFFRMIPLQNISQITLKMDGTGEDSIPYATYLTGSSKIETSTLNDVKERLGLTDDEDEDDSENDEDDNSSNSSSSSSSAQQVSSTPSAAAATPTPTSAPSDSDNTQSDNDAASQAEQYIGQSLDSLIAACGEPQGSDYQDEPETGETGYHYYSSFTVSTTVDEDGNEVVAGVW